MQILSANVNQEGWRSGAGAGFSVGVLLVVRGRVVCWRSALNKTNVHRDRQTLKKLVSGCNHVFKPSRSVQFLPLQHMLLFQQVQHEQSGH